MSHQAASTEGLVIRFAAEGFSPRKICSTLSLGDHRVSRLLREFQTKGIIPTPLRRRRPPKVIKTILDFIDIRTRQGAHLSRSKLALNYDTGQMLSIRERMRNQEPIPELCGEERPV
jgi:transposase